ncbi:MAG: cytosine permease [Actinobacteria bacterium]|nr:cytosine permease [Actinomycetota bacterium]
MSITATRPVAADPGIRPVAPQERVLGAWDVAVLWSDLGIGLLVLVTGALLVPALGLAQALVAIVLGSVIGVGLLALGASAGGRHALPMMVLLRPVLGIRGSWVPSALNALQLVGWVAVELWAMSYVADLVVSRVFGFQGRGVWLAVMAVVCTGLALWGPVGVTKVWLEKFGFWVISGICLVVTVLVVASGISFTTGTGGFPSFGQALDLVIAMPISWLPLVADYTRFARGGRSAFVGTFWGYLVANVWLYTLGALLVLNAGATPDPGGIAVGILAVAGGSVAGLVFLVGLLVGETDEAFANLYSTAVSIQNILPRVSHRVLIVGVAGVGAGLAAFFTMVAYESFLFFIGSVFVPLFGILAADHFVVRRGDVEIDGLYDRGGRYWFKGGFRVAAVVPWVIGFFVFHWVNPSPLSWWMDAMNAMFGEPVSAKVSWLPGSIPSFAVSFVVALVLFRRTNIAASSVRAPDRDREATP